MPHSFPRTVYACAMHIEETDDLHGTHSAKEAAEPLYPAWPEIEKPLQWQVFPGLLRAIYTHEGLDDPDDTQTQRDMHVAKEYARKHNPEEMAEAIANTFDHMMG